MMNDVLRDFLHKFVTVYLDGVFIFSRTLEEHLEHMRLVLQRLKEDGLNLRLKKCCFGLQEMEYLGYTVSAGKISVSTKKVEAVADWPVPTTRKEAATLYPLHAPPRPWHTVGLEYLTHLLESNDFNSVRTVVDHLTRMARFMPCTKTVTAEETAILFLHGVNRLHGLLRVLVSDRDPKFVSGLWHTLWRRLGMRLNMSSSRDPETYVLTERVNITFQQLLRCFCCHDGSDWTTLLPQVEFAYNASRALGIEHTPFEANFGLSP
jgi:hypothetical protein